MINVRCPCCGRKRLRIQAGTPLTEGQMCGECRREARDARQAGAYVVSFRPRAGVLDQMGSVRRVGAIPPADLECGWQADDMDDEQPLPF